MKLSKTMKRLIMMLGMLVCLLAARVVFAQTGVITYESRVNLHRNIPADRQEMKAMMPEFRITKFSLAYNEEESLYKSIVEDEEEQFSSGGGGVRMVMRIPKTELYTNSSTTAILSVQEMMGKKYLIQDSVKVSPWKFGTETKEILGYTCRMAYFSREEEVPMMRMSTTQASTGATTTTPPTPEKRTVEITAWYTDQIRTSLGPDRFNTLPGTVLAIDINNGERVLVARNVEKRELKKNELYTPDSGTKVTQDEFRKIMQEQMEKMRANGGGMMIRN
jgi:GLPGLI family protein